MSGLKEWALRWAGEGFRVFPIRPDQKHPPIFKHFGGRATMLREPVEDWWTENPNYNIGIVMDGLVCIDADTYKNPVCLSELEPYGIDPEQTLAQSTARGGTHLIYTSPQQYKSTAGLRYGIDIKSGRDAYILVAASAFEGKRYALKNGFGFVQPLPDEMASLLTPWGPAEQAAAIKAQLDAKIDDPTAILGYTSYCQAVHPAIQGQHGDHQTFIVAAMGVKDFALSPRTTYEVMLRDFNPRCVPPWSAHELQTKVLNGYEYGSHQVGGAAPNLMFQKVRLSKVGLYPEPARAIEWMVGELLIPGEVTVLAGLSGAGKSSLVATLVAHMISAHDMGPFTIKAPIAVITLNTEDEDWISHNRVASVFAHYGWPIDEVAMRNILVLDKTDSNSDPLVIVERNGRMVINPSFENRIEQWVTLLPHVKALCLDALPNLHEANENDNSQMTQVMGVLNRLATKYEIAILVIHHAGKGETAVRGASSIVGQPRLAYTVAPHPTKPDTIILTQVKKTHGARLEPYDLERKLATLVDKGPVWTVTTFKETSRSGSEDDRIKCLTVLAQWMTLSQKTFISEHAAGAYLVSAVPGIASSQFRRRAGKPGKLREWLAGRPLSLPLPKIDGTTGVATLSLVEKGIALV